MNEKNHPLKLALSAIFAQEKLRTSLSDQEQKKLEKETVIFAEKVIKLWLEMRRYDQESRRFSRRKKKADIWLQKIEKNLKKLRLYTITWELNFKEDFNRTFPY